VSKLSDEQESKPKRGKHKPKAFLKGLTYILLAALIFFSGFGFGSGRLAFFNNRLFKKSVQPNLPQNLDYTSVEQVYDTLRQNYEGKLDVNKLLDGLKQGLAASTGDPYTEYLNKSDAADFNNQLSGTFTGIGAELSKDADGNVIVISPLEGYPAQKAGVKPKDIITKVDNQAVFGQNLTEVVNKIRGNEGTSVKLTIARDGKELNFDITRAKITLPSVTHKILDGNIGYLRISRFADDTTDLARTAANEFAQTKVKGIILDVRSDPGGLLDAAVAVSSLWLKPDQTVLTEKRGGVIVQRYKASGNPILASIPTVVLINDGSASASEITAGALHDNGAAEILGEKSFGKGSVQSLEKFTDGSVLKVTIAKWFTPNDKSIDKEGITPDKQVKLTEDDAKAQRDPQLDAAKSELNK
jgi:carboxyl-terminal processing protease